MSGALGYLLHTDTKSSHW